jgi:uracil phosphoribosyltransferase
MSINVLFVCTGNTCRSPMAAAIAEQLFDEAAIPGVILSAGVSVYGASPASRHAVRVMKSAGLDIARHVSRPVSPKMAEHADLILAMTRRHKDMLLELFPQAQGKAFTLAEFAVSGRSKAENRKAERRGDAAGAGRSKSESWVLEPHACAAGTDEYADIPDPYGGSRADYEYCAQTIRDYLEKVVVKIREGYMPNGKLLGVADCPRKPLRQPTNASLNASEASGTATAASGSADAKLTEMLHVTDHPLVQSKITMLRNIETGNKEFRELVGEIATLIGYEATRDIPLSDIEVETPLGRTGGKICGKKFGIVPILRAGLGMTEGLSHLLPTAKIGHIGLYRDPESLQPVEYYCKLPPDCAEREIYLLDPMLATGGTASAAIGYLKDRGVKQIKLVCLIAAPEGVQKLYCDHPDVHIYTAAFDEYLNGHGYIVPGLGDAGDRLFGTK